MDENEFDNRIVGVFEKKNFFLQKEPKIEIKKESMSNENGKRKREEVKDEENFGDEIEQPQKRIKHNNELKNLNIENQNIIDLEHDFINDGFKKEGEFFVISEDNMDKKINVTEDINLTKIFRTNEKSNVPDEDRERIEKDFMSNGFTKEGNLLMKRV